MENVFCSLLGVLFVCGSLANLVVLRYVTKEGTLSPKARFTNRRRRDRKCAPRHVCVYIGALLISDLLLLTNCPFIIHDIATNGWSFGSFLCKFVYGNESFHKVLTGFLLAALSFDQLITVRKILSPKWRTVFSAVSTIICCIVVDLILQLPVFMYTDVRSLDSQYFVEVSISNSTISAHDSNLSLFEPIAAEYTEKCLFTPPHSVEPLIQTFTISVFVIGFCAPTFLILITYGTIIYRMTASGYFAVSNSRRHEDPSACLRQQNGVNGSRQITWYVSLLVAIYLCCWAPYWIVIGLKVGFADESSIDNDVMTYILLHLHLLPYLNATLNPFAYSYLVQCCCKRDTGSGERRGRSVLMLCSGSDVPSQGTLAMAERQRRLSLEETWAKQSGTVQIGKKRNGIMHSA